MFSLKLNAMFSQRLGLIILLSLCLGNLSNIEVTVFTGKVSGLFSLPFFRLSFLEDESDIQDRPVELRYYSAPAAH